jgi:hypothetical protein
LGFVSGQTGTRMENLEPIEQHRAGASDEAPAPLSAEGSRPRAAQAASVVAGERNDGELTDRQRDMLDFERTWWQFDDPREEIIQARFGCSADEYYAELNQVLELPGAMAHDPLVVRRFHRRRLRRRRSLMDGGSAASRESQGGAKA